MRKSGQQAIHYYYFPTVGPEDLFEPIWKVTGLKISRKKKRNLLIWLAVDITLAVIVITMLLYRPGRYNPPARAADNSEVNPYLTHELLAQLYNNAQEDVPFELMIEQDGLNEAIANADWPYHFDDLSFETLQVFFTSDTVMLMGPVIFKGFELVITAQVSPTIDEEGLLHLDVEGMKVGVMNLTPIAKIIGQKMYEDHSGFEEADSMDLRARIAAALFAKTPFPPVFQVGRKVVRIDKIDIREKQLTINFSPVTDPDAQALMW